MLGALATCITVIYYALVAYVCVVLLYSLAKSKSWEKEILFIVVLIPFLLRLFMLK
jgi:hypothetical protein